jgi:hypothetical protein
VWKTRLFFCDNSNTQLSLENNIILSRNQYPGRGKLTGIIFFTLTKSPVKSRRWLVAGYGVRVYGEKPLKRLTKSWLNLFLPRNWQHATRNRVAFTPPVLKSGGGFKSLQGLYKHISFCYNLTTGLTGARIRGQDEVTRHLRPVYNSQ